MVDNRFSKIIKIGKRGFTFIEILISLAIFSLILLTVVSFLLSMNNSNSRIKASGEALENAKKALEEMAYEIRSAESIYTPTTTASQLSLETTRYLPSGESVSFIDFFLCGSAICLKKESQDPVAITPSSVQVSNLAFSQISTGSNPSVQINLTVNYLSGENSSSVSLTSSASLRSY